WAVWCRPCVSTFPHLKEWHSQYKDKGLEIVGVTGYYETLDFDASTGKLKRLAATEKLTQEKEQEMLKAFGKHHKLEHRLLPLDKEDQKKVYTDYQVGGIPHVVLIDRKGVVRFVRVGADEESAKEIEAKLKELIDEKP